MSESEGSGGSAPGPGEPEPGGATGAGGEPAGGAPGAGAGQPTEEEIRAALEEQMRRVRVEDVLVQTAVTLVNLAGRRLGLGAPADQAEAEKDLEQARLAIEGARALLPLLPGDVSPIRDALAQLQMAYAREAPAAAGAGAESPAGTGGPGDPAGREPPPAGAAPTEDPDRAKARSKIWTPPGT